MDSLLNCKSPRSVRCVSKSIAWKCLALAGISLFCRTLLFPYQPRNVWNNWWNDEYSIRSLPDFDNGIRTNKFLEVPQIVWGLNNQKIAFARACLTARMLNRTLLVPSLSASLFYKEVEKLQPISFDKVFQFERFNSLCNGFVRLGQFSDVRNRTPVFDLRKGSGRRWTLERDLKQLEKAGEAPIDDYEVIRVLGKNPFLWHDHWPVKDYAKVFECMVVVDEIEKEADKIVAKIRDVGEEVRTRIRPVEEVSFTERSKLGSVQEHSFADETPRKPPPYVAVHMRIEIDWMIHCKKLEQRRNISEICSSKEEIMDRVGNIVGLNAPTVLYLAVADSLLEDSLFLTGWRDGLVPYEKKKLGVDEIYKKHPYLIQSAIDYEVCSRADVFVGNSFSTFSSLVVLERTQRAMRLGVTSSCEDRDDGDIDTPWRSYAYNLPGESHGAPRKWMTNMLESSLKAISYGSDVVSCRSV